MLASGPVRPNGRARRLVIGRSAGASLFASAAACYARRGKEDGNRQDQSTHQKDRPAHARISVTTRPATSVSRSSRPLCR